MCEFDINIQFQGTNSFCGVLITIPQKASLQVFTAVILLDDFIMNFEFNGNLTNHDILPIKIISFFSLFLPLRLDLNYHFLQLNYLYAI